MKIYGRYTALLIILIVSYHGLSAQHNIYVSAGYGSPANNSLLMVSTTSSTYNSNSSRNIETNKGVMGSWGHGKRISIGYGYELSKFIELGLSYDYSTSPNYSSNSEEKRFDYSDNLNSRITYGETTSSKIWIAGLSFKLNYPLVRSGSLKVFFKSGPIISSGTLHSENYYTEYSQEYAVDYKLEVAYKEEFKGKHTFGAQAGGGLSIQVFRPLSITLQMSYSSLTFSPAKSTITSYIENGFDRTDRLSPRQKETIYTDEVTNVYIPDSTKPGKALQRSYSSSSISYLFGVQFKIGNKQPTPK